MNPSVQPFVELLPLALIISIVYCAIKEDGGRKIALASTLFFARLYGGVILFSVGIHILCRFVR